MRLSEASVPPCDQGFDVVYLQHVWVKGIARPAALVRGTSIRQQASIPSPQRVPPMCPTHGGAQYQCRRLTSVGLAKRVTT